MIEEQNCSCGTENCNCGSDGGGCGSCECGDFYESMEGRLMQMAFLAHKSVLFDKIRERVEKEQGGRLDKIADLVVEASRNKFKTVQEIEKKRAELREKLKEVFEE